MGIKFSAKKFPTFFDDFFIIIGIDFINDIYDSESDNKFHRYSFLLDENFDFMSQTINFYEDFMFNIPLFKELKINFLKFFNVSKNKLIHNFKKTNSNVFKNDININNIINLRREDDAFTVFKNINYENIFELRDISKLESISKESTRFNDKIEKGYKQLNIALDYITKLLLEGHSVTVQIKGYCSSLYQTEYNRLLAQRRINSTENYMRTYNGGILSAYMDNIAKDGKHVLETEHLAVGKAESNSPNPENLEEKRMSIYLPSAMEERRIEIQVIKCRD